MHQRIESIAQQSYGKLLAYLAGRYRGDIQAAEDALADAFARALQVWPAKGEPLNPEAWLLRVAGNQLIDGIRKQKRYQYVSVLQELEHASVGSSSIENSAVLTELEQIPDERLQMMFACAHPAIDPLVRTPLLLQAVLGLSAQRIASAFLVSPQTMSQRLVRGKIKIRDAGISFELPENLSERVQFVLDAIYGAFSIGWNGTEPASQSLVEDAISLARIVMARLPSHAEAAGLLALMLYCDARREARRTTENAYVPLDRQDPSHWDTTLVKEAEWLLSNASQLGQPGRYQLEAAIQSAHMQRRGNDGPTWKMIVALYSALETLVPTIGGRIGKAAAMAQAGDAAKALLELDSLEPALVAEHQPYWAVRADVLRRLGDAGYLEAYDRAIGLSDDNAVRQYLLLQKQLPMT